MKLYGYFRSSASYRARIGLALKGLAYEYVTVSLLQDGGQQHGDEHKKRNLMEQVPVLEVEHEPGLFVLLSQSVAILEYLEERYPDPPLLPTCLYLRARTRKCVEIVNSGIQPLQNLGVIKELKRLGVDEQAFARRAIEKGLRALEFEAEESQTRFMIGDAPTLADVALVPQLFAARRFGVDVDAFPNLARIDRSANELDAFIAAHPDRQPDAPKPAAPDAAPPSPPTPTK